MLNHLRAFWRNILKREVANADLDEEVRGYLEMTAAEKVRCGMAPEEALREARRELGGVEQVKQGVRDTRAGVSLDIVMQDVLYASGPFPGTWLSRWWWCSRWPWALAQIPPFSLSSMAFFSSRYRTLSRIAYSCFGSRHSLIAISER